MLHVAMQAEQEMQAAEESQSVELSDADAVPEVPVPVDVMVVSSSPLDGPGMTQPRSTALTTAADEIVAAAANEHGSATPAAGVVPGSQGLAHTAAAPDVSFAPWMSAQLPLASPAAAASAHPPAAAGPELGLPDLATLDELTALPDVPAHPPAHLHAEYRRAVPARPVAEATEGSEEDLDRQLEAATARAGLMQRPSTGA